MTNWNDIIKHLRDKASLWGLQVLQSERSRQHSAAQPNSLYGLTCCIMSLQVHRGLYQEFTALESKIIHPVEDRNVSSHIRSLISAEHCWMNSDGIMAQADRPCCNNTVVSLE